MTKTQLKKHLTILHTDLTKAYARSNKIAKAIRLVESHVGLELMLLEVEQLLKLVEDVK